MKIQFLNGGLANQIFQYIFVRFAELYHPVEAWYFDDSFFFVNHMHNGYELEKVFGIKANLLSNYFDPDVWKEIIARKKEGVSLPQTILDMGMPIVMLTETLNYKRHNPFNGQVSLIRANQFCPEIITQQEDNTYYHGYWINKNWLGQYKQEILSELTFPQLTDENNLRYADMINNCCSVGIHVRRGDFIELGWDLSAEYYRENCEKVLENHPEAKFFIFTDDLAWCKENAEISGFNLSADTTYITGNTNGKNYIDLQLLSMCRGIIMSNSSFCYLAALLSNQLQFAINPTDREIF